MVLSLLIALAAQLQPAVSMTPAGVAVRPVDDAAARVRLVLTAEGDVVGSLQIGQARREVDVMRDQYRFARADVEDEALMAAALGIVLQHFFHLPRAAYRRAATVLRDDLIQRGIAGCGASGGVSRRLENQIAASKSGSAASCQRQGRRLRMMTSIMRRDFFRQISRRRIAAFL